MVDSMKLHLESMDPINEANINIKKITVVGGHNSTGKSTLSKFLYSFLRSNSFNRQEIAYESIADLMKRESYYISRNVPREDRFFRPSLFHMRNPNDFDRILDNYEDLKEKIDEIDFAPTELDEINEKLEVIDALIDIVEEDSTELYISLMRNLIESEFSSNYFNSFVDINSDFIIDFKNHDFEDDNAFKSKDGFIVNDVFYIDSVSLLDTFEMGRVFERKSIDHSDYLKNNLTGRTRDVFDDKINANIKIIENEVNSIINGRFIFERGEFKFISNDNIKSDMRNTAFGIKQIGIIQLLLANRKLKDNSFLIIDEPEVNLHPDWQLKLAKILVLISKGLNVSVYINSHSPLFIESVYTYADYYDILDETSYHLAEKSDKNSLFDINEVEVNSLSKIYDNLGKAYFEIDVLRLEKKLD